MSCDQNTLILISSFVDGEATPDEAVRAKAHLEECPDCRKLIEEWRGQKEMFEWAYEVELPEIEEIPWQAQAADSSQRRSYGRSLLQGVTARRFAWAGALAAVVIVAFGIYHLAMLPPLLRVGTQISAINHPKELRMKSGVDLQLGPNSVISRIDDNTLRLKRGWVSASVTNGSGIRVLTERIKVVDQGTRFTVGAGPKLDYVQVEEGLVSVSRRHFSQQVNAGQVLVAQDTGEPTVTSLPKDEAGKEWLPFGQKKFGFMPRNSNDLDWDEGLANLAQQFPNARYGSLETGSITKRESEADTEYGVSIGSVMGLRSGLRKHYVEILQVLSGETVSSEWEIPVALIQIIGSTTELPSDVYYVRLVLKDSKIVWRFSGSKGGEADFPLTVKRIDNSEQYGSSHRSIFASSNTIFASSNSRSNVCIESLWLIAFPGDYKPVLDLNLYGSQPVDSWRDRQAMLEQVTHQVSGLDSFDLKGSEVNLLYLDPARKHRLMIVWNGGAVKQLYRLSDAEKRGVGGTVILGAVAVEASLEEPKVAGGVYLLKFVLQKPLEAPHIELVATTGGDVASSRKLREVRLDSEDDNGGARSDWTSESMPEDYGKVYLAHTTMPMDKNAFPVQFQVIGHPEDKTTRAVKQGSHASSWDPTETWAEGWIRIAKP